MAWEKVKLGDVAKFNNGVNFGKNAYAKSVKLIGVSNFGNRLLPDYDELEELSPEVLKENDYLKDGDIVFVRSNGNKELVGRCMLVENLVFPTTFSGFCIRSRFNNLEKCNPRFFAYYFKTDFFRKSISGSAIGANIQNLNQGILSNHIATIPDYKTQKRIADILSAYDDLIENNQKQVKLFEETAQRIYKEWFVDFHFPGYERALFVDGMPEGWQEKCITDVYDFKYGKILPTKEFVENGPIPVYGASKKIGKFTQANCFEPKVLVGSRGNAGFVHRTIEDKTYVTNNSFIITPLDSYNYLKLPFVFESFRNMDFVAICTGAAQPQLTLNSISSLKYVIPSKVLVEKYCDISKPLFDKIAMAYKQIHTLADARDRLLPKLMNEEFTKKG